MKEENKEETAELLGRSFCASLDDFLFFPMREFRSGLHKIIYTSDRLTKVSLVLSLFSSFFLL